MTSVPSFTPYADLRDPQILPIDLEIGTHAGRAVRGDV